MEIVEAEQPMSRLLIKDGHLIEPSSGIDERRDVLIEDGRVAAIEPRVEAADADVVDAGGCFVAPGFLDIHVHLREPGIEHAETIETGAKAAAAGGFTSVCCMPNTIPVNDSPTVTSFIVERARHTAIVNVFPIGAITKGSKGEQLAEIGAMKKAGIVAISDDGRPVMNSRVMRRAMEYAASFGLTVIDHCEDLNLSMGGDIHEGAQSVRLGLRGIPACSEDVMVARDIILSEVTGGAVHIAHISTRNAIEMVRQARRLGIRVTSEVTPHHFALTDSDIAGYDGNYKMKPPLRGHIDKQAVLEGIIDGVIDAIATDHAPHTGNMKMQEFERCPFGVAGLETAIALTLEELVHPGTIGLKHMVELFTTGPARVIGLDRGKLFVGGPGDVTLFSTSREWVFDVNESQSKSKNSPFHGRMFRGGPVATIVAGKTVWQAPVAVAA
ncbi:MAG: dihydroorotase [Bryobacterales bacterium]|nr:dihydroorotase [Bryobacterales bacterium]